MRETDGSTQRSERCQRMHFDAEAERILATPTGILPLGPKIMYLLLWERAGSHPEHIVVRPRDLASSLGLSDAKSARDYLDSLSRLGAIDIVDRDRRRGTLALYVYRPADIGDRRVQVDRQRRLPLRFAEPRGDPSGQIPAQSPGDLSGQIPAPTRGNTSYPRTRAGGPGVVDDDVDVVVSSTTVADSEIQEARAALKRAVASWKSAGIPEKKREPDRRNRSTWLKTHTLMLRGEIPHAAFDAGLAAVIAAHNGSGIIENAWAVMWGVWVVEISKPRFHALLRSLELPPDWENIMRGRTTDAASAKSMPRRNDNGRGHNVCATPAEVAAHEAKMERLIRASTKDVDATATSKSSRTDYDARKAALLTEIGRTKADTNQEPQ